MKSQSILVYLLILAYTGILSAAPAVEPLPLLPWPKSVKLGSGHMKLEEKGRIIALQPELEPLAQLLSDEIYNVAWVRMKPASSKPAAGDIILQLDKKLKGEQQLLSVSDRATVSGASHHAVAMATVTLLQAIGNIKGEATLPKMQIEDEPEVEFRALLVDVARLWHPIQVLKDIIVMCRMYKVNYIQLHLTDDQLFTFQSKAFPNLATKQSYTQDELADLEAFASVRGVYLLPELETPGHSAKLVKVPPFGRKGLGCVVMADEKVYEAFDTLIGEMCAIFKSSPYFHIGTDEVAMGDSGKTPEDKAYMQKHGLDSVKDLFHHHIVRMDQLVRKHGKKTIRWGSFAENSHSKSKIKIPSDIPHMVWEERGNGPVKAVDYPVINAAWKPLYIVGSKAWLPQYLLESWHVRIWQNHQASGTGRILSPEIPVMGAMMCAWEHPAVHAIPGIRWRLPAMTERIYNPKSGRSYADYESRFARTDELYNRVMCPVKYEISGLVGRDCERLFTDSTTFQLSAMPGCTIRYTIDNSNPTPSSPAYTKPVTVKVADVKPDSYSLFKSSGQNQRTSRRLHIKAACFDKSGRMIGQVHDEILYANPPLVHAKVYYSPKMFDHSKADWVNAHDWEKMGLQPNHETVWPSLVFSMPSAARGATYVPLTSGILTRGKIKITQPGHYAFPYTDEENGTGEVYINDQLVTNSTDGIFKTIELKAGIHDIQVRYAHPHLFHWGKQQLSYAKLDPGQDVLDLLIAPAGKGGKGYKLKKGPWKDHAELLVPMDMPKHLQSAKK